MSQGIETAGEAERKRAAVEMIARHEGLLRRTALRYSLDVEDAEDACQRALEIVLTKAPTTDPRELVRWTRTVVKHEALAVRASRERLLSRRRNSDEMQDPIAAIPSREDPPEQQIERREEIAHSREALQALKPAELRALGLLAEGYSYAEIGELTGFSRTKVNRLLAEGRARFRAVVSAGEDGRRCRELRPLLSSFCDGESSPKDAALVREHLRACAGCRATMRSYRAAPGLAAGLPLLPEARSLLGRVHDFVAGLAARLPGLGGEAIVTHAGTAVAAVVAVGTLPAPAQTSQPVDPPPAEPAAAGAAAPLDAPPGTRNSEPPPRRRQTNDKPRRSAPDPSSEAPKSAPAVPETAAAPAVEYEVPTSEAAPSPPETTSSPAETASESGSAAGEFGP